MSDRRRILVIEDEPGIRMVLEEALDLEGYRVTSVPNGQVALDLLNEWAPDVIVLDLMMPVMSGFDFRRAQRALAEPLSSIPVIVLSGAHNAVDRGAEMDVDAVIAKPFDLDDFIGTLDCVLGCSTTDSPPPSSP